MTNLLSHTASLPRPRPRLIARPGVHALIVVCLLAAASGSAAAQQATATRHGNDPEYVNDATATDTAGSVNLPMDSWIYPALERLSTLGLIPSQSVLIRPWTRKEALHQLREAELNVLDLDSDDPRVGEADRLFRDLDRELKPPVGDPAGDDPDGDAAAKHGDLVLESVYSRAGVIAGPALADSFHFGQTWWNDYGRPETRGTSALLGFTARARYRRLFFYARQEGQRGPATPGTTAAENALFNQLDNGGYPGVPPNFYPVTAPGAAFLQARPLELYGGIAFAGAALSFGKQEIYWGPTTLGPWSFSSNAEPTWNLRLLATRPHDLPFFPKAGTFRYDMVFGRLDGHRYPAHPYFNGGKFTVNLHDTLELGFTRWSILWGEGHPATLASLGRNLFSTESTGCQTNVTVPGAYGDRCDPGDRKSGWDMRLHPPGLDHLLTLYADSYADDDLNPLAAPRRAAWQTGLYVARLPGLPALSRFDLRVEMASSEELSQDEGNGRIYINNQYRDGNTNRGLLLGNAVGRDGRAFQYQTTYWHSARTTLTAGVRQNHASPLFLPGGSTITDGFLRGSLHFREHWTAEAFAQYERFYVPAMMPGRQHNVSARLQVTWTPQLHLLQRGKP